MGREMSSYFNGLFAKHGGDYKDFLANLGIHMWGDRISFYYFIPPGRRSKSAAQRRLLLRQIDSSGVSCLLSKYSFLFWFFFLS